MTDEPIAQATAAQEPGDWMMSLDERVYYCWSQGLGLGATRKVLQRRHGLTMTVEQVRQHFICLADRFAGGGQ